MPFQSISLAGINLDVFGLESKSEWPKQSKVAVAFALHGRGGRKEDLYEKIESIVTGTAGEGRMPLIVVAFDHRNHGTRMSEQVRNTGWHDGNSTFALDMYSIQSGTAQDVSHLMDFLAPSLFPNGEHNIARWICLGVSLGGHSTWIAGANDKRLDYLIPIIGSPSTLTLLKNRAASQKVEFGPPTIPDTLLKLFHQIDPAEKPLDTWKGRKILALCGGDDTLVPVEGSDTQSFCNRLEKDGVDVTLIVEQGLGHAFSWQMAKEITNWLNAKALHL